MQITKGINYAAWTSSTIEMGTNYGMDQIFVKVADHYSADHFCGNVRLGRFLVHRTPERFCVLSFSFKSVVRDESVATKSD